MYLFNDDDDKVLKKINRTISKEKEAECLTKSTIWTYGGIIVACILLCFGFCIYASTYAYREIKIYTKFNNEIDSLEEEISTLNAKLQAAEKLIAEQDSRIGILEAEVGSKNETIADLNQSESNFKAMARNLESENIDLTETLEGLTNAYNDLNKAYVKFAEREELYDKYEYALFEGTRRTDLTYDMCSYGEQLMIDYGLDPDLLFSIGMTESNYTENAKSPNSTATGFHQFLKGTGEWVYESLGYTEPYNHTKVQTNGYKSLQCGAWYLNYLYDTKNGDIMKVIEGYRGVKNPTGYIKRINSFLATKNKNLNDVGENSLVLCGAISQ